MKRTILQKAAAAALFVLLTAALLAAADFLLVDDVHSYSRVMLQELYLDFAAAEGVCTSRTALRSEEQQLVYGEIGSFVEDGEELLSHGAAGAYDCNFHIC